MPLPQKANLNRTGSRGIDAQASQGGRPLNGAAATQNSPDIRVSGLLPRRAHIHGRLAMYRSAPLGLLCRAN